MFADGELEPRVEVVDDVVRVRWESAVEYHDHNNEEDDDEDDKIVDDEGGDVYLPPDYDEGGDV